MINAVWPGPTSSTETVSPMPRRRPTKKPVGIEGPKNGWDSAELSEFAVFGAAAGIAMVPPPVDSPPNPFEPLLPDEEPKPPGDLGALLFNAKDVPPPPVRPGDWVPLEPRPVPISKRGLGPPSALGAADGAAAGVSSFSNSVSSIDAGSPNATASTAEIFSALWVSGPDGPSAVLTSTDCATRSAF